MHVDDREPRRVDPPRHHQDVVGHRRRDDRLRGDVARAGASQRRRDRSVVERDDSSQLVPSCLLARGDLDQLELVASDDHHLTDLQRRRRRPPHGAPDGRDRDNGDRSVGDTSRHQRAGADDLTPAPRRGEDQEGDRERHEEGGLDDTRRRACGHERGGHERPEGDDERRTAEQHERRGGPWPEPVGARVAPDRDDERTHREGQAAEEEPTDVPRLRERVLRDRRPGAG